MGWFLQDELQMSAFLASRLRKRLFYTRCGSAVNKKWSFRFHLVWP